MNEESRRLYTARHTQNKPKPATSPPLRSYKRHHCIAASCTWRDIENILIRMLQNKHDSRLLSTNPRPYPGLALGSKGGPQDVEGVRNSGGGEACHSATGVRHKWCELAFHDTMPLGGQLHLEREKGGHIMYFNICDFAAASYDLLTCWYTAEIGPPCGNGRAPNRGTRPQVPSKESMMLMCVLCTDKPLRMLGCTQNSTLIWSPLECKS